MDTRCFSLLGTLALAGCLAAGCNAPPSRGADADAPVPVQPPERFDPYPVVRVRKVLLDGKLAGYLKVRVDDTDPIEPERTFLVYDEAFRLRGFFTDNGRVFRVEANGELRALGARTREDSFRVLLGGKVDSKVGLAPMDPPKTIG